MIQNNAYGLITQEDLLNAPATYKKSQELERELRSALKKKSIFDKSVISIRNAIMELYENIIFMDYDFATEKDIEMLLWKTVFYKMIEEYRKHIRKCVAETKTPSTSEDLRKICHSFHEFLQTSSLFYENNLIKRFMSQYNLKMDGTVEYTVGRENVVHKSFLSCHRCFIFMGDLARYHRDMIGQPHQEDWALAGPLYHQVRFS